MVLSSDQLRARARVAEELARRAGTLAREMRSSPLQVRSKSAEIDLVTNADEGAQRLILDGILAEFPQDGFVAEELDAQRFGSGIEWGVDPIDGTTNYVAGISHWCVSIGCVDQDGPAVGVIFDPVRDELFTAVRRAGLGGPVAPRRRLSSPLTSVWATGFGLDPHHSRRASWAENVQSKIGTTRTMGSLALDLAWVAAGRFDGLFYECGLHLWDFAAGAVLVGEADLAVHHILPRGPKSGVLIVLPQEWDPNELFESEHILSGVPPAL